MMHTARERTTDPSSSAIPRRGSTRYGVEGADAEAATLAATPEGFRHRAVYLAGYALGQLRAGRALTEADFLAYRAEYARIGGALGLPTRDVEHALDNGVERGGQRPRSGDGGADRPETVTAVAAWWQAADADESYRDRKGPTTRRILAALAMLAAGAQRTTLAESFRQVAEAAGVSVGTVHKHRDRLAPWATVEAGADGADSLTVWSLHPAVTNGNTPAAPGGAKQGVFPNVTRDPLTDPAHDRWARWSGGWAVYMALVAAVEGATVAELAAASGRHPRTVARALGTFAAWGVAERCGDRWHRPATVTVPRETFWRDTRRARHAHDRTVWRSKLACWADARERRREHARAREATPRLPLDTAAAA